MPAGDRTGPWGEGSRSGRGAGFCSGFGQPGYMNGLRGRGAGMGWRSGTGRGCGPGLRGRWGGRGPGSAGGWFGWNRPADFMPARDPAYEKDQLERESEWIKTRQEEIQSRLSELNKDE